MNTTMTKNTTKTRTSEIATSNAAVDAASKGVLAVMTGAAAFVGLWAAVSLVAAMVSAGPIEVIKGWFSAVGM